jgi:ABC-2 type transport system permease protein
MFSEIFLFELKYRFRRPATYLYGLILFLVFFIQFFHGFGSEKINIDSPYYLADTMAVMSVFAIMIASAIMGVPVYREIEHQTQNYFFSYPISEKGYIMGRYLGSLVTLVFVVVLGVLGAILGSALGPVFDLYDNAARYEGFRLSKYAFPFFVILIPNMFFSGTLFFSLVALIRKIFVAYTGGVLLFIAYLLTLTLASDLENKTLVDYLDPFAISTHQNATKYFTPAEKNTLLAPLSGGTSHLLGNRLLWTGVGFFFLFLVLFRFDFQRFLAVKLGSKKKDESPEIAPKGLALLPQVSQVFSQAAFLKFMVKLSTLEFRNIIKDIYFIGMMLGGGIFLFLDGWFADQTFGVPSRPMTYFMLEAQNNTFFFFVLIIIVFYTGEVVHRDKEIRYANISDALPVPNWMLYGSKYLALVYVVFFIGAVVVLCGLLNQTLKGYFNYELGFYVKGMVEPTLKRILMVTLAFFVHIIVNSKITGHIINVLYYVVIAGLRGIAELDYNMFFYQSTPTSQLSDMNGLGHFATAQGWFLLYWAGLALVLLVLGSLLWPRGTETSIKVRWALAKQRLSGGALASIVAGLSIFIGAGVFVYYNVSVKNQYNTSDESRETQADYEKKYRKYLNVAQPKITYANVSVDIYPQERAADAKGTFWYKNKTNQNIDSLHLSFGSQVPHVSIKSLTINGLTPKVLSKDTVHNYFIYQLPQTLKIGDSVKAEIATRVEHRGFPNEGFESTIVYNGTFMNNGDLFPTFGYNSQGELSSEKYRKKYNLPIREYEMPAQNDPKGLNNLLFSDDADYMVFEGTVSTVPDQIAIMPGYLQKEWTANGRRYFQYKQEGKMDYFFSICSARFDVARDKITMPDGRVVETEIYHHPKHKYNLSHFMDGLKDGVAYFSKNFRPYNYSKIRILEFPRYASFAQSFPNTIPYSESFGWVADFSDPNSTDYAYYVTAHEVAHQWWGHQICPSYTRGANQISESMAEYSSLMVLKNKYGENIMANRLKYSLDRYLGGRGFESKSEETLLENERSGYIWYDKGSLVLYALQDYIGENRLNEGFKRFADAAAFREKGPFATTNEWYSYIKASTPDSMKYFLEDSFEKITLYENRITKATAKALGKDQYQLTLDIDVKKLYYDKKGKEIATGKGQDLIEVGIFAEESTNAKGMTQRVPLYLKKQWLKAGKQQISIVVKGKPIKAGIDPYNKLIDRVSDDNILNVEGI